ncbi:efflux RND transporter periplasmic adaptor subunit [Microvirga pudoricolor]|uniref:efflux RND transporter periplasmic adaptor subunit n=1 Tax=Microvirga pudoricolor TaxID=2778729 RepID=UPI00194EE305|nr:efflux RND transporter periplasmic adaptor subunit [Microvirga pudoricolor]MBM6593198.1 efflux RND transporter periplasmic adaptor subunit [Microvirga pudoricolor]
MTASQEGASRDLSRNRPAISSPRGHRIAAFSAFFVLAVAQAGSAASQQPPAPSVVVAPVALQDVTDRVNFVGNIEAMQQVDLRARVEGFLETVAFSEGAFVQKDALLYQIERAPYTAALDQAQASEAAAEAQLASANATLKEKQVALERQQTLARQQFASQAVLDQATAERDQAAAAVQQANAQIQSAKAQIETANLNLSYTTVKAPIAGRIGKTAFTVGNLVSPSSGVLATIVQMSPIRVSFPIAERDYVTITRFLASPEGKAAQGSDDLFKPQLVLPDGSPFPQPGRIEFINNQVDVTTGTVSVRAVFENPENLLLPGQYVSVTVQVGQAKSLPVVPQAAVLRNQQGPYVFVVDKDNRAQIRQIQTGITTETGYAVTSGLQQGENVIVNGTQKVRPGVVVQATPAPPAGR